jgi:hypothetical protein
MQYTVLAASFSTCMGYAIMLKPTTPLAFYLYVTLCIYVGPMCVLLDILYKTARLTDSTHSEHDALHMQPQSSLSLF